MVEVAPVVVIPLATALALPRRLFVAALAVLEPTGAKAIRLGKLKVEPSPWPYLIPIVRNRSLYVERETGVPSQSKNPVGTSEFV